MKRYTDEDSVKQQADVLCYAFSPDLLNASEADLREFLSDLARNFPKTENGDGMYKPMGNDHYLNVFNSAYTNVRLLIESKQAKRRHAHLVWCSVATLAVLIGTLANTIYEQCKTTTQQATPSSTQITPNKKAP